MTNEKDSRALEELRRQIFLTARRGGIAHLASSYSCLEILYALYLRGVMRYDAGQPDMKARDRLVLSKGHGGLALYAVMSEAGYFPKEELDSYLQAHTRIGGEPSIRDVKGVEASTGSLGHGLPVSVGLALGQKLDGLGARTFCIVGDGECQEGSIWEAAMAAAAQRLDNLTVIIDANGIQKLCSVEDTMGLVNWREKFEAFGWCVEECAGHDIGELFDVLSAENRSGKPRAVIAHTVKGKGVSLMENSTKWHYRLPRPKELGVFEKELGLSKEDGN